MFTRLLSLLALLCVIGGAIAQTNSPGDENGPTTIGQINSPADEAYMAIMQRMQEGVLAMEMNGDAGPDYARIIIAHHQGAIEMTEVLLKQPKVDPALKQLANRILAEQRRTMANLQKWLSANQTK